MSDSSKIFLSVEEQLYLMTMFEVKDPQKAIEKFVELMVLERANPQDLNKYLKKIMKKEGLV